MLLFSCVTQRSDSNPSILMRVEQFSNVGPQLSQKTQEVLLLNSFFFFTTVKLKIKNVSGTKTAMDTDVLSEAFLPSLVYRVDTEVK